MAANGTNGKRHWQDQDSLAHHPLRKYRQENYLDSFEKIPPRKLLGFILMMKRKFYPCLVCSVRHTISKKMVNSVQKSFTFPCEINFEGELLLVSNAQLEREQLPCLSNHDPLSTSADTHTTVPQKRALEGRVYKAQHSHRQYNFCGNMIDFCKTSKLKLRGKCRHNNSQLYPWQH